MIEPKFQHRVVVCNSKLYALGGYNDPNMTERSTSIQKYDFDLQRWFVCNPMKLGRADF
jgi:hypothetical protein